MYVPDKDIFMVTTADAQGRQGGVQLIYEAFWHEIYDKIATDSLPAATPEYTAAFLEYCNTRTLFVLPGSLTSPVLADINGITYQMDENICQMKTMKVDIATDTGLGTLTYENASGVHTLSFGLGYNAFGQFPDYDLKYAASAAFRMENTLLVKIQIIDSAIGNLFFSLNFKGDYVTVMLRKIEESLFGEYNGVFSGRKI